MLSNKCKDYSDIMDNICMEDSDKFCSICMVSNGKLNKTNMVQIYRSQHMCMGNNGKKRNICKDNSDILCIVHMVICRGIIYKVILYMDSFYRVICMEILRMFLDHIFVLEIILKKD